MSSVVWIIVGVVAMGAMMLWSLCIAAGKEMPKQGDEEEGEEK